MKTTEISEHEAVRELRRKFTHLRRTRSTAIIRSGGRRTIFGCVCGAYHTASTEWNGRNAKHVIEWREAHADCAARILGTGADPEV